MPIAFSLLLVAIGALPLVFIFDGFIAQGLLSAALATGLAIMSLTIPPGEAGYLARIWRPVALILAIPALWMVIQILPSGFLGLAHPIWQSAAEAFGRPIGGSISIDPGLTLLSLGRYLLAAAVMLLAAAVAIDRQRAKLLLFMLTGASTLIAIIAIVHAAAPPVLLSQLAVSYASNAAAASAALGVILSAAVATQQFAFDQRGRRQASDGQFAFGSFATLAAFVVCWTALLLSARGEVLFAAACGLATLAAIMAIRRFDIGPWGAWAFAATALIAIVAIVAIWTDLRARDPTLAFASGASKPLVGTAQRILADARWTGAGAGSFSALIPIYRGGDDLTIDAHPPTAAAAIAVEVGRPMLIAILLAAVVGIIALVRGALARGRDSFYPAAAAGCLVTLSLEGFSDAALFSTAVATMGAAAVGLGLIQHKSRTSR